MYYTPMKNSVLLLESAGTKNLINIRDPFFLELCNFLFVVLLLSTFSTSAIICLFPHFCGNTNDLVLDQTILAKAAM